MENLMLQATHLGLHAHGMAGFDADKVYHTRSQIANLDRTKASGLADRKLVHIANIDRLTIDQPRELSCRPKSQFVNACGIRKAYGIPDTHEPVAALGLGYEADPEGKPQHLRERDAAERERESLDSFVFEHKWNQPAKFVSA